MSPQGAWSPSGSGIGFGNDSGSADSETRSGISGVAGNTAARTGDAQTGLKPIFDADKVQKEVDAQAQITQTFGQQASSLVGEIAKEKIREANSLLEQAKQARADGQDELAQQFYGEAEQLNSDWGENGKLRIGLHTVIGGLTGGAAGAAGSLTGSLTAVEASKLLKENDITPENNPVLYNSLVALASTGAGAVVGGASGTGSAFNEVTNNYLTPKQEYAKDAEKTACKGKLGCLAAVELKYALISGQQETGRLIGIGGGIGLQSYKQAEAVVDMVANLPGTLKALKALVADPDFRSKVGESVVRDYQQRIDTLTRAYNDGGWDGSVTAGVEAGRLAVDVVGAATAVVGAGKVAATVAKTGTNVATQAITKTAVAIESATGGLSGFNQLLKNGGLFTSDGRPLMDFRSLTNAQKGIVGDMMGTQKVQQLLPGAQEIGRIPGIGQSGIDGLYKVNKPGVDYVVIEFKFGSSKQGMTLDGLQGSDGWLTGVNTNYNRILESVSGDRKVAGDIRSAMDAGRVEKWLVNTDQFGRVTVGVMGKDGKLIPNPVAASKIIGGAR
ncbi:hypothetical protein B0T40_24835 [Chromobacterium haemolyticum]|nr:hypothetical protein B0T40_24835 [Chromobacterium haemolyticum]